MPKKITDTSYDPDTPIIKATQKRNAQDVKKKSESKKPVKKVSETPKDEESEPSTIGNTEYSTDRKGRITVSQKVEVKKDRYANVGRKTDYDKKYVGMILDFFYGYKQEIYLDRTYYNIKERSIDDFDNIRPDADGIKRGLVKTETHQVLGSVYPTIERFACMIGVDRDTPKNWADARYPDDYRVKKLQGKHKNPEFFRAYTLARQMQEAILIEGALDNRFNSQFAIFLAKNHFGYKDKSEVDGTLNANVLVKTLSEEKERALDYAIGQRLLSNPS